MIQFPALLTTGMHGTEHCNREHRMLSFFAPRQPFSPVAGSTLESASQSLSLPGPDARNGLSLACNGFRFHGFHSRVNGPDLLLRFLAGRFGCPFDSPLRYRSRLAP